MFTSSRRWVFAFCQMEQVQWSADDPMLLARNIEMTTWTDGCNPTRYPGIYKTATGYRVRVRAIDPKTGMLKERNQEFENIAQEQAVVKQAALKNEIRQGGLGRREENGTATTPTSLFERKVALGNLKSAKSRERWADTPISI